MRKLLVLLALGALAAGAAIPAAADSGKHRGQTSKCGKVRGGFYRWLLFPDATVEVDGTYLVRNGKLIVP